MKQHILLLGQLIMIVEGNVFIVVEVNCEDGGGSLHGQRAEPIRFIVFADMAL
uniref:Candidate secreted effector n=1 Tax=Meloidogyne incognita TaxID=6306 RepID=A0A914LCT1_MELIC